MILPRVRSSFGRADAAYLTWILSRGDEAAKVRTIGRLDEAGLDALLDDPRTLNAVLSYRGLSTASAPLVAYLLVRHALLEDGIEDMAVADYLASVLLAFGNGARAQRIDEADETKYEYLLDIVQAMNSAEGRRAFLLSVHLGNFALWLTGLFPGYITARVRRKGAPGFVYYEQLGATGYRLAARSVTPDAAGMDRVYRQCADQFPTLRVALNRIADRYLFPAAGDPIDRLLREVSDGFRGQSKPH